jgi:glycolate oxidase FAD binding subunit
MRLAPSSQAELADIILHAKAAGQKLEIRGGGSKALVGAPDRSATILDMRGFAGVIDYDPPELVLTAGAATKLREVEAVVAASGQMLAFEPFDHAPMFGAEPGEATIGGVVAAGVAGSRRVAAGGARDHLLGFAGVSGGGEYFVGGSRVVKNVTGYDLPKLVAGSWGRLVAVTQVTLKVLPAPRETATRVIEGLDAGRAYQAMARAMGAPAEVSAAFHVPAELGGGVARTVLRVQGFGPSVAARCALLAALLADFGALAEPDPAEAEMLWRHMRTLAPLADGRPLWRVSLPARAFPAMVAQFHPWGARWLADWAGGLLWLTYDGDPATLRGAAAAAGGHAMLIRGDAALRAAVPAFQPQPAALAALETRVRRAFDPAGVFETGRFGDGAHAD